MSSTIQSTTQEEDRIQKRVNKILETRLDVDKNTLDALNDLSTFFTENTLKNRRNLRSQIEGKSVGINENFLKAFREVKISVDNICSELDTMAKYVETMNTDLESSKALTQDLIKQSNTMQEERQRLQLQQKISEAFLNRFQLSNAEHETLYGTNINDTVVITPEFFVVLDHVKSIHADCRILMQSGYQTAALDIMEEMTLHQEGALERLYRWTQNHCRNLDNEIGALVVEAMSRLQDRPVLFKYVVDEYAIARRAVLVRYFIEALTEGGPGGNPKPIEMHAHDPKRYIGDMFAWLHQSIPNEKENLMLLLKKCDKHDLTEQTQTALAYIVDGVCHPLKVRVDTILTSEKDTIVLFALSNLLRFYQQIIKQVVKGGSLEQCLIDLQKTSEDIYLNSLSLQVRTILQRPAATKLGLEPPQRDLVPPASVGRLLNLLKEILSVATMVDGRQTDITKIVSCVIDPLLQSVQESASHLPTVDMAVYLLNCLYHMQSTLTVFEYMDERVERLQAQSDAQIDTLISEQASSLVANLNLGPIYTILQNNQTKIETNLLKIFMSKMDAFLEMPDVLLLPQIQLLMSGAHRMAVQKRAFSVIVAIYKQIYERVHDPQNGFENPEAIFSINPEQIAKILATT